MENFSTLERIYAHNDREERLSLIMILFPIMNYLSNSHLSQLCGQVRDIPFHWTSINFVTLSIFFLLHTNFELFCLDNLVGWVSAQIISTSYGIDWALPTNHVEYMVKSNQLALLQNPWLMGHIDDLIDAAKREGYVIRCNLPKKGSYKTAWRYT